MTVAGELPEGVTYTTAGRLHNLGSLLIFFGLLVAAPASTRRQKRRGYRLAVLWLAVALFAITPILIALGIDSPGWGQRAFIAVGVAWQALFLAEVRRCPSRPHEPRPRRRPPPSPEPRARGSALLPALRLAGGGRLPALDRLPVLRLPGLLQPQARRLRDPA